MKIKTYLLLLGFSLAFSQAAWSQRPQSRAERLERFAAQLDSTMRAELEEAVRVATLNGWPLEGILRIDEDGQPVYNTNHNNAAAATTTTTTLRSTYGVDGQGMKMGIWECCNDGMVEGNVPLLTHQDFGGRVSIQDATLPSSHSFHATHVAGTLVGEPPAGFPLTSRGMAFKANLDAYGINSDGAEMAAAGASESDSVTSGSILLSNHSYGSVEGWRYDTTLNGTNHWTWTGPPAQFVAGGSDPDFGLYNNRSMEWDSIAFLAPYYLIVKGAGNEGNQNPFNTVDSVRNGYGGTYVLYNTMQHPLGDGAYAFGFDNIATASLSKNILTVGAVANSMNITSFSSTGPVDNGRIKPDICGVGESLTSASNAGNSAYGAASGTSMSAPNVAGSLLLLQEYYRDKHKVGADSLFMKAATLKALALHTANDRGNPGPDYTYGWGVLDAKKAGDIIEEDTWSGATSTASIIEESYSPPTLTEWVYDIRASGTEPLIVTLVYADSAITGGALANDLDLRVERVSNGQVFMPYTLNVALPYNNATTGDNDVDNLEQVRIASPAAGAYRVKVMREGTLVNNAPQDFSIIVSGLEATCHGNITHTLMTVPGATYTANQTITSSGIINPGTVVTYTAGGKVVLKPGFHAKQQTSTGTGFFKTAIGGCN